MNEADYLRALASAITSNEDLSNTEANDILYQLALRIYALLRTRLPNTRFERLTLWPQLRAEILPQLASANDDLRRILIQRLVAVEALLPPVVERFFGLNQGSIQPREIPQLLDESRVLNISAADLFTANATTGVSPFVFQLLQLLERQLYPAFFADAATPDVVRRIVGTITRSGRVLPAVRKGTVANAWVERWRSITAAALWSTLTPAQKRGSALRTPILWRWNAVLDPKTCPVCRPLHGRTAQYPSLFDKGPPPLHPLCRCILVPEFNTPEPMPKMSPASEALNIALKRSIERFNQQRNT